MPEEATLVEQNNHATAETPPKPNGRRSPIRGFLSTRFGIAILTSVFALVAPITTLIYQAFQGYNQRALAQRDQAHQVRMAYLTLITKPDFDELERLRVMRFLEQTEEDKALTAWAREEIQVVRKISQQAQNNKSREDAKKISDYLDAAAATVQADPHSEHEELIVLRSLFKQYASTDIPEIKARLEVLNCELMGGVMDYATLTCRQRTKENVK
jgi:hypothetical protein